MNDVVRPRRSALYMPGANARALAKARTLDADALIFDLEDAVAPDAKATARTQVVAAFEKGGYGGREVVVRINGLDTAWGADDVQEIAPLGVDGIVLPKVESAEAVRAAEAALIAAGAPAETALWCMMETPLGILRAETIAGASPRIACLVMGTSDLTKELNARHTADRLPMLGSLSLCLLAARAHGLSILDGVHLDLSDDAGLVAVCEQGRDLGFDGKSLIHPNQIEPANRVFGPSEAEQNDARRIVAAFQAATAAGQGVVVLDGQLVENLHVDNARRLIALADAIAARMPA